MPVVSSPELASELGAGTGLLFMAGLFTAPALLGMVIEPVVLAWSDYLDRRRVLFWSLIGMTVTLALCALAPSMLWLSALFGLWGVFVGIADGVAQGALVLRADEPERELTRWTLSAELGDLAAPLLLAATVGLGFGWRGALFVSAGFSLLIAAALWRAPIEAEDEDDDDEPAPIREALQEALRAPGLLLWLGAVASCTLMDELLLTLVALRVEPAGAAGEAMIFTLILGGVLGLALADRLMSRVSSGALLVGSALLSALSLGAWVWISSPIAAFGLLALLGASIALQYPLARARCYAAFPGRPGLVNALDRLFGVTELLAPLVVGAASSAWGVDGALLVLLLQPLCVGLAAVSAIRAARRP